MTRPAAPEQRTVDVDLEHVQADQRTLRGHAAVFNVLSDDLGGFRERIAPGAFADVLDADVRLLVNHKPDHVLARTRSGTLRLSEDARGLAVEADLPDTSYARDLRESLRRGDLDGMSFRFRVGEEDWTHEDGTEVRTVQRVEHLEDVCLATYPAYPSASVELRTRPDNEPPNGGTNPTEETIMADQTTVDEPRGGLRTEDRAQISDEPGIEDRIRDAFRSVRKGESRSLTTTSAASIAPPELSSFLFDRLRAASALLASGVQVIATDRDAVQWPKLSADVTPAFYNEGAAITPSDPTLVTLTATPRKLATITQVSNETVDDSEPSVVDVLNAHVAQVLALRLDLAAFEGSGTVPEIRGLKNVSGVQAVSMGTNGAAVTNLDSIADAFALLEGANAIPGAIVMHPRTWNQIRKLKDSTGAPLLGDGSNATAMSVYGVPVYLTSQLSTTETQGTATAASSIYIYDVGQVVLVRRQDATIELDRSRLFNQDMSELRGRARVDLVCPNPPAICRIAGVL